MSMIWGKLNSRCLQEILVDTLGHLGKNYYLQFSQLYTLRSKELMRLIRRSPSSVFAEIRLKQIPASSWKCTILGNIGYLRMCISFFSH